jgi:hypothetical protein
MADGYYSPHSVEDVLTVDVNVDSDNDSFRQISSPEASPVSDSAIHAEESVMSPGDLQITKNRVNAPSSQLESASFMYWKTNLVPFSVALEDGFYDPGRIDVSEDFELMHSMPPISSYFHHDNFG